MKEKTLFYITWISMCCTFLAFVVDWFAPALFNVALTLVSAVFNLSGTALLLNNGTFIKSPYYRWTGVAVPLIIFGMMFKIMHWPGALYLILSGFSLLCVLYILHFLRKTDKDLLSTTKLLFVYTFCISRFFTFVRLPYAQLIEWVPIITLSCAIFLFTFPPKNKNAPDVLD